MEIGYDDQLQIGEDGYYPMALMPAKKTRLEGQPHEVGHDATQLSVASLPSALPSDRTRFDNRMKEIEHMVKEISKKSD